MRILVLTTSYPPVVGGLGANVSRVVTGLLDLGHDVSAAVKVWPPGVKPTLGPREESVVCKPSLRQLFSLCRGVDVVHMHGFWQTGSLIALALRKPLIWTHYEYDTDCPIGIGWFRNRSRSFSPLTCTACMWERNYGAAMPRRVTSLFARRALARMVAANVQPNRYISQRLALPRTQVIRYGVSGYQRGSERAPQSPASFGYFGRLIDIKGCDVLLASAKLCADRGLDFTVTFVGGGTDEDRLRSRSRELGLESRVTFEAEVALGDVQARMRELTAVVVPSLWDENGAIVILEAMAAGVPVIATRVGGNTEYLDEIGLLVSRGSASELAAAMQRVIEQPELRRRLSAAGRQRFARLYSNDLAAYAHERLYRNLIRDARHTAAAS